MSEPNFLSLIQNLQSLAQSGLAYSKDAFDQQRFRDIQEIAVSLLSQGSGTDSEKVREIFFEEKGYRTPKLDVRAAIFESGKLLLVKEKSDGLWTLPGGWVDVGESPSRAVEREVIEESTLVVKAQKLMAVHDINVHQPGQFYHTYKLVFLCEIISGVARAQDETSAIGYFSQTELPELSWRRTSRSQVELCFRHLENSSLATEFD